MDVSKLRARLIAKPDVLQSKGNLAGSLKPRLHRRPLVDNSAPHSKLDPLPHLTEYQRKQRELPRGNTDDKELNPLKRKSSVEPLDKTPSPLPALPDDLLLKRELIENSRGFDRQPTPPKTDRVVSSAKIPA